MLLAERKLRQQMRGLSDHNLNSAMAFLVFSHWILYCFFLLSFAFCLPIVQRRVGLYMTLKSREDWEVDLKCEAYFSAAEGMRRYWRLFADRATRIEVLAKKLEI